jgi:hypothetical protein
MARIAVIGDVGGCATQLAAAVAPIIDEPDTVIIQVGDLIDRGPDSAGVLALVQRALQRDPSRWVQLIGNHESQYLGGRPFWPEQLAPDDAAVLHSWWMKEWLRVAVAVRTADGEEFLITHAGLTETAWNSLGGPVTAGTAADLLNTRPEALLRPDQRPLWAEAGPHVYPSWMRPGQLVPFGQIHGHSTIVSYRHRAWLCGERIQQRSTVDWTARHTITRIGGNRFIAIDPKHGTTCAPTWAALVFHDATLLS